MKSSTNKNLEKLISELPYNIEAEQILLGAMLRDNRVCDAVGDLITSEVFFDPLHRPYFRANFQNQ